MTKTHLLNSLIRVKKKNPEKCDIGRAVTPSVFYLCLSSEAAEGATHNVTN